MKRSLPRFSGSPLIYKLLAFAFFALFTGDRSEAQMIPEPTWTYSFSQKEVAVGDVVELIFKANIQPGFYVYSNDFDPNLGPMITEAQFEKNAGYELVGVLKPVGAKKKFDEVWGGEVSIFTGKAEFRQKVKILTKNPVIKGVLYFQSCSESSCVPFSPSFEFTGLKVKPSVKISPSEDGTKKADPSEKTENTNLPEKEGQTQ